MARKKKRKRRHFFAFLEHLSRFAARWWYLPLVSTLAAVDAFVVVVPTDALLVPAVLAHRRQWIRVAFWVTLGSAVGAVGFAALVSAYGLGFLDWIAPGVIHSDAWQRAQKLFDDYGGLGLAFISAGPLPQHAAVALAGLARMSALTVFAAVFGGRLVKYLFIAWASSHSPKLLKKLGMGRLLEMDEKKEDRK